MKLHINIAPRYINKGGYQVYAFTTIFLSNNIDEKYCNKNYNKIAIEDNYNNLNLEKLISIFKNYEHFSYEIKTPAQKEPQIQDIYIEKCEILKNEIINFIENNQHPKLLAKNLKLYSIISSIFVYLLFGFIIFCTVSMLHWL